MNLLQPIEAGKSKERVFGQIINIIEAIHGYKTFESNTLMDLLGFKISQRMEEERKAAAEKAAEDLKDSIELAGSVGREPIDSPKSKSEAPSKSAKKEDVVSRNTVHETNENIPGEVSALSLMKNLPERDNIDGDFKPVIIKLWQDMAKNY